MLLKPKRPLFVLVPNMNPWRRACWRKVSLHLPQHLNYFTAETLQKLSEGNFSIVELRSTHFNPFVIWQDWCRGGEEVSNENALIFSSGHGLQKKTIAETSQNLFTSSLKGRSELATWGTT